MPPRKRRRVAFATGASMGTLLADIKRDQRQMEYDTAKAKAEAREKSSERSKNYARIVTNFVKDRTMTYDEASAALKAALKDETDPELKGILSDYIDDIKLTKQSRDVNNIVDDYTYGRKTYSQFVSAMSGMDRSNGLIAEAISKNLEGARKTENNRLLTKWGADYKSGGLPYDQYVRNLNELRSSPDQKDPNDVAAITQHLTAAQQNEQQINDNKAYVQWQSDGNSGAALQYFQGRLAQSKNVQDANTIEQYIKTIQAEDKRIGSSQATSSAKTLDAIAEQAMKSYEDKTLKKELDAAKGDPRAILDAYGRFAKFIGDRVLTLGAPKGVEYRLRQETLVDEAMAAASDAVYKSSLEEIDRWKKVATDKTSDPRAVVNAWKKVAAGAAKTSTSPWLIAGHDKFDAARDEAANRLAEFAREQQTIGAEADVKAKGEIARLYDGAVGVAQFDKDGKPLAPAGSGLKSAMNAGIKFDGTAADGAAFAEWIINNPQSLPAIERAANVNISVNINAKGEKSTTFSDTGGPQDTGKDGGAPKLTLSDLLEQRKKSLEVGDLAQFASEDAFDPRGAYTRKIARAVKNNQLSTDTPEDVSRATDTPAMNALKSRPDFALIHNEPTFDPGESGLPTGDASRGFLGTQYPPHRGRAGPSPAKNFGQFTPATANIPNYEPPPPQDFDLGKFGMDVYNLPNAIGEGLSEVGSYLFQKLWGSANAVTPNLGFNSFNRDQWAAPPQTPPGSDDLSTERPAQDAGPSPEPMSPNTRMYARGGIIDEPVDGTGRFSGAPYTIAEEGPERVVPLGDVDDTSSEPKYTWKQRRDLEQLGDTPEDVARGTSAASDASLQVAVRDVGFLSPADNPATFERMPSGRPTPKRLGVDASMGGMPREEDRTFRSSDQLIWEVLPALPEAFQAPEFQNRHIDRPTTSNFRGSNVYGDLGNAGAWYAPSAPLSIRAEETDPVMPREAGGVSVPRGNSPKDELNGTYHELLHAMQNEHPTFHDDEIRGYPQLQETARAGLVRISNHRYRKQLADILGEVAKKDWAHVWTALADLAIEMKRDGQVLPPALAGYFAPLWQPYPSVPSVPE